MRTRNLTLELLPGLERRPTAAVSAPDGSLTGGELASAAARAGARIEADEPVLLWATSEVETIVGLVGALAAGAPLVPVNPHSGAGELEHIVADVRPRMVIAAAHHELPPALCALERLEPDVDGGRESLTSIPIDGRPAFILYTSGTTGQPKGVVLSYAAVAANLDALATVWQWTDADVLVHSLPLFHVHGLILGVLGPLRVGCELRHLGTFDVERTFTGLRDGGTMLFGVPTMYHRLAAAAENDAAAAEALGGARLLVSGSAPLATADHERIERASGARVLERYGMTETLMISSIRLDADRRPGYVGPPLPGVEVRVELEGHAVPADDATIGNVWVRSPSMFSGYLNRPDETAACFREGWFATGDMGTLAADGCLRLVGRTSVDLIKSGGYRIGAGEIEAALQTHPAVEEVAVRGLPDADLGERIVAWVVLVPGGAVEEPELIEHVGGSLSRHKHPREIRFVSALPRNAMGKVQKQKLTLDD